jgi:hypothetical integral membrane protein (TIGR02206 family)
LGGVALIIWLVVYVGVLHLNSSQRRKVVLGLVIFSLGQELADDLLRVFHGVWFAQTALPLHLCSLGILVSVWALLTQKQSVFEVAYFLGFVASTQAPLTPDNTRWRRGELDVLRNFLSHGAIVLNVFWLGFVDRIRCRAWSWLKVLLITNVVTIPIALRHLALGSNCFFICWKPEGVNPFLIGEWPWYALWFEVPGLVFFVLVYLPMWWVNRRMSLRPGVVKNG